MIANGTKGGENALARKEKGIRAAGEAGSETRNRTGKRNLLPFYQAKQNAAEFRVDP